MTLAYKVVEVSPVTDDELTVALNAAADDGWLLERIDYVKDLGVRRPQMAFLYFSRTSAARASGDDEEIE